MATQAVKAYLEKTNRPYSANDILQNLHKEWGKTALQKSLDELVAQEVIREKTYGKQKVYCIKQPESTGGDEELSSLDALVEYRFRNYFEPRNNRLYCPE
jgi:26S proteasome regulatory subunit (ATPase 3-interacting protein)